MFPESMALQMRWSSDVCGVAGEPAHLQCRSLDVQSHGSNLVLSSHSSTSDSTLVLSEPGCAFFYNRPNEPNGFMKTPSSSPRLVIPIHSNACALGID